MTLSKSLLKSNRMRSVCCPLMAFRAYPVSEFVVANTLAKRKKLEPNEINFSQGFSQNLYHSTSSFGLTLCLLGVQITFANSLDPDQARYFVGPDLGPNCLSPSWY